MLSYTLKRLLQAIPTLLIVITLSFFLMRVAPGGPFDGERRLPPEIEQMAAERRRARAAKNWELSDRLRDQLQDRGYTVRDTPQGMQVFKT